MLLWLLLADSCVRFIVCVVVLGWVGLGYACLVCDVLFCLLCVVSFVLCVLCVRVGVCAVMIG